MPSDLQPKSCIASAHLFYLFQSRVHAMSRTEIETKISGTISRFESGHDDIGRRFFRRNRIQ